MADHALDVRSEDTAAAPRLSLWEGLAMVLGTIWTIVVLVWTLRFWSMLREAAPVIDLLTERRGVPRSEIDWYLYDEAREIFCIHGEPERTIIGREIDASWAYAPMLFLGGLGTYLAGLVPFIPTLVSEHRLANVVAKAMLLAALLALVPMVLYAGDIMILTDVTE